MKYGLKDQTIEKIQQVFMSFHQIDEVILYGSRAKGNYRPGSDIDLTLKGKELNQSVIYEVDVKLDDLLLPYLFDVSIYHQIDNPDLIDHINRVGVVFYKK